MTRIERIVLRHQIDSQVRARLTASGKARLGNLPEGSGRTWPPQVAHRFTHERRVLPSLETYDR